MSRRGEVPFVAVRVGRSNDPREVLGLAHELKIDRATALGYVVLWEEFILEVGDAMTGRVRGYSATHVAAKLGWRGRPAKLLEALKRAGLFAAQKGTFFHPAWLDTPTGDYARRKANDRETWRKEKETQRNAARARLLENNGADVSPESGWTSGSIPAGISPENAQKERMTSGGHRPPTPPQGGGGLASRRWAWMLEHHPRPTNPEGCTALLEALTDDEWRMVVWAWTPATEGGGLLYLSKIRLGRQTSYQFLHKGAFLQIRRQYLAKLREAERPQNGHSKPPAPIVDEAAEHQAKHAKAIANVLAALADPDLSEKAKDGWRRRHVAAWGDKPWEGLTADPPTN